MTKRLLKKLWCNKWKAFPKCLSSMLSGYLKSEKISPTFESRCKLNFKSLSLFPKRFAQNSISNMDASPPLEGVGKRKNAKIRHKNLNNPPLLQRGKWFSTLNKIKREQKINLILRLLGVDLNLLNVIYGLIFPTLLTRLPILLLIAIILLPSCNEESLEPISNNDNFPKGVFITNEGAFNNGNASISFYDFEEDLLSENIFEKANNRPLGDVLQSIKVYDKQAYLVVNNSSKIEVVDIKNFKSIKTIDNLTAPRYIQMVDNTTAYISDIYRKSITVIDLNTNQEKSRIPFSGWSEEMVKINDEMFITQPSFFNQKVSNQIFVVNTNSNEVIDSIIVGYNPVALEIDKNNDIWVICNGELNDPSKLGGLYKINAQSKTVLTALPFTDNKVSFAPRLAMNTTRDVLYYLKLNIYALPIENTNLPEMPLLESLDGRDFYALGVNPATGEIYVGDSGNFVSKGTVSIHNPANGNTVASFSGGVGINGFYFN